MKDTWLAAVLLLALAAAANAAITGVGCMAPSDGSLTINSWIWDAQTNDLNLNETLHEAPAHMFATFLTDTLEDPTVRVRKSVENDTTFDWTDYHINVYLDQTFQITQAVPPSLWTAVITPPEQVGSDWVGAVDYYYGGPGSEVPIGSFGDFGLTLTFVGNVTFKLEQIPTPEPASVLLLAAALLPLRRLRTS